MVMAIILLLYAFTTVNLSQSRSQVSLDTIIDQLESDIRTQQLQAMSGLGKGGIYFGQNQYTLFQGTTYVSNDPSNFVINLDSGTQFQNIKFPGSTIVFASTSGEINAYNTLQNSITVYNPNSNIQKVVTINKYGALSVQ